MPEPGEGWEAFQRRKRLLLALAGPCWSLLALAGSVLCFTHFGLLKMDVPLLSICLVSDSLTLF